MAEHLRKKGLASDGQTRNARWLQRPVHSIANVLVTLLHGVGAVEGLGPYLVGGLTPRYLVAARPPRGPSAWAPSMSTS